MIKVKKSIIFIIALVLLVGCFSVFSKPNHVNAQTSVKTGGDATFNGGVYTLNNGYLESNSVYNGFILTFNITAEENAQFNVIFGDYNISFNKDGATANGFELTKNQFDFSKFEVACTVRIEAFGYEFSMGVHCDGYAENIYENVLEGQFPKLLEQSNLKLTANSGQIKIGELNAYTLGSSIEIETENYDKATEESFNKIVKKPDINGNNATLIVIILVSASALLLVGGVIVTVFVVRRKKCKNQ